MILLPNANAEGSAEWTPAEQTSRLRRRSTLAGLIVALGAGFLSFQAVKLRGDTTEPPLSVDTTTITKMDALVVQDDVTLNQNTLSVAPTSSVFGFNLAPQDIPRTISQIAPQQFQDNLIANPNDYIYYTPGLAVNGGQTDPITPTIRGQTGQVYINGFLAGLSGITNGPSYNANPIESVDIVDGPANTVYGPSALTSGYVNYTTKQPFFDRTHTTITADFGSFVTGGSSFENFRQQIDVGGPIISDKLAYRVSVENQEANSYYEGVKDNYHDIYGALTWKPDSDLTVTYNAEWKVTQQYYSSGWDRTTEAEIDNGTYLAGPATPVLQLNKAFNGVTYFSPVLNADGTATGTFIARTKVAGAQVYTPAGAFNAAAAAAAGRTAQVFGFVLDPSNIKPVKIYGYQTNTSDAGNGHSWDLHQQFRAVFSKNHDLVWIEEADLDGGEFKRINAAQTTGWANAVYFEDRFHAQGQKTFHLFGHEIKQQSDTGISFRVESTDLVSTTTPTTNAYGNMLVTPAANPQFGGAQIYPTPPGYYTTNPFFGNIPTLFLPNYLTVPYEDYLTTPGNAWRSWDTQTGLFTEQNFAFGPQWGLTTGARADWMHVNVVNPITAKLPAIAGNSTGSLQGRDSADYILPDTNASLTFKPVPWITTYATFDFGQAYNGNGPGAFTLTGYSATSAGHLADSNFHSNSFLYETGAKFELVPRKLFATVDGYYQERSIFNTTLDESFPLKAEGVDFTVRYQPSKNLSIGLNASWITAHYTNISFSSANNQFAGNGIFVDDATLFGTRALTNTLPGSPSGNYAVLDLPPLYASAYIEYRLLSGLGFTARAWWKDRAHEDETGILIIPPEYNLDVGLFYQKPGTHTRYDLFVTNATNARIILSSAGYLEEPPLGVKVRIKYAF